MPKLLIPLLLLAVACASRDETMTTEGTTEEVVGETTPAATVPVPEWASDLTGSSGTAITGEAFARPAGNETYVSIAINGATGGAIHPWHIHDGNCGSNGPIIGEASAYPVLNVDASGGADAESTIGVALDPGGDYYVNVHQSPEDQGTIVACGELDS